MVSLEAMKEARDKRNLKIKELYNKDYTIRAISERTGVGRTMVLKVAKQMGCVMRGNSRRVYLDNSP